MLTTATTYLHQLAVLANDGPWDHHDGWPWFPFVPLVWLVVIGVVVWLIVRYTRTNRQAPAARARDILAERYARGEITAEQYRERLRDLDEH